MFYRLLSLSLFAFLSVHGSGFLIPKDRCLGLVLKGGANKGAYEAGAIYALVMNLPPEDVMYDVVSGISVGALNAAHIASYPQGDEVAMSFEMIQLWTNLASNNLYNSWPHGGIINGLMY